jgi:hypothetical protein
MGPVARRCRCDEGQTRNASKAAIHAFTMHQLASDLKPKPTGNSLAASHRASSKTNRKHFGAQKSCQRLGVS